MISEAANNLQQAMNEHRQGNLYDADLLYERTLRLEPGNIQALRLKGMLARERGDIDTSLELLERATLVSPDDPDILSETALSHMAAGELTDAEQTLRKALSLAPDAPKALVNLGAVLQQRGHVRASIKCYEQALTKEPDDFFARCNLAKALSDAGDFDAALRECATAQKQSDGDAFVPATRGAVLLDQERYADARDALAIATKHTPDDMALVNLSLAQYQLGDVGAATRNLRAACKLNPDNARAAADLANCLSTAEDQSGAIELCEQFLARHPGERLVVGAHALALHNAGQEPAALALTDCDTLVRTYDIDAPKGIANINTLNDLLANEIRADPSRLNNPVSKSTFGGEQTGELDLDRSIALQALREVIQNCVSDAAKHFIEAGLGRHPVMAPANGEQSIRAWATLLQTDGHQTSHMHPLGWLSGVYYVHLPPDMSAADAEAGWLEFNSPPQRFHCTKPAKTWRFEPREGQLIVFPSWFWHQTIPFKSEDERISIAFDIVPTAALRML
jgi:uncharacterized protein (TIGR02466 family)